MTAVYCITVLLLSGVSSTTTPVAYWLDKLINIYPGSFGFRDFRSAEIIPEPALADGGAV